ncbi:hypothetical protein RYH73_10605 [Olivibacter sp. CPCC 100613]|uniref:hypothetical protein n=1 Tax=Olivibacter sp. CPCC 100613 TaxID=3079931 RepID=UPI002FF5CF39
MAKQTSIITFSGKLGEHVHYRRGGKHFTKRASKEPHNFSQGSIAAQQAFALGSTTGKHLKTAFQPILKEYKYEGIHNRLAEACKQIFRNGPVVQSESNRFQDYNIKMLLDFNFNKYAPIDSLIRHNPIELTFDPSGKVGIVINEHNPMESFSNYLKMHAISIRFLFSTVDLDRPSFSYHHTQDIIIPLDESLFIKKQGTVQLGSLANKLLICCTQIRYYGSADHLAYSNNKKLVSATISAIDYIKDNIVVSYPSRSKEPVKRSIPEKEPSVDTTPINWE